MFFFLSCTVATKLFWSLSCATRMENCQLCVAEPPQIKSVHSYEQNQKVVRFYPFWKHYPLYYMQSITIEQKIRNLLLRNNTNFQVEKLGLTLTLSWKSFPTKNHTSINKNGFESIWLIQNKLRQRKYKCYAFKYT